jgi:hypothetical protein
MNEGIRNAQVTVQQMKRLMIALDDLGERLPKNPKLYAFMSEALIDDLTRMLRDLDEYLEPLKHVTPASVSAASLVENPTSTPAAPGPIESAS